MIKTEMKDFLCDMYHRKVGCKGEYSELKEKTAIVFEGQLSRSICQTLCEYVDNGIVTGKNTWVDDVGSDSRVFCLENDYPEITKFLDVDNEIKKVEKYLGVKIRSWTLMGNKLDFKSDGLGSGGGAHRDSSFRHQVKIIWYLNDVGHVSGAFSYIHGSNYRTSESKKKLGFSNRIKLPLGEKLMPVYAVAGSKIVCDTKCIHMGLPIKAGVREAITLYTFESQYGVERLLKKLQTDTS